MFPNATLINLQLHVKSPCYQWYGGEFLWTKCGGKNSLD